MRPTRSSVMTTHASTPQSNIELMRRAFSALGRKDVDACVKLMPSDFRIKQSRCSHALDGHAYRGIPWHSTHGKESRVPGQRTLLHCRWNNCRGVDLLRHAYADGPNRGD